MKHYPSLIITTHFFLICTHPRILFVRGFLIEKNIGDKRRELGGFQM
jgi:hypothetical protein